MSLDGGQLKGAEALTEEYTRDLIGKQQGESTPLPHSPPLFRTPASSLHWLNPIGKDPSIGVEVSFLDTRWDAEGWRGIQRSKWKASCIVSKCSLHPCLALGSRHLLSVSSFPLLQPLYFSSQTQAPRSLRTFVPAEPHAQNALLGSLDLAGFLHPFMQSQLSLPSRVIL